MLNRHCDVDPAAFSLRFAGKKEWPVREIAEQLHCYPRAEAKLGPLHQPGMIYLREALEQASGYASARWRASVWANTLAGKKEAGKPGADSDSMAKPDPKREPGPDSHSDSRPKPKPKPWVADLTAGLGIDAAAFAGAGFQVSYCERNATLCAIARHNHRILGLESRMDWHTGDGLAWLEARVREAKYLPDLVYIDPARRRKGRRVMSLDQSEPAVSELSGRLRSLSKRWLIKLSPMSDPSEVARVLPDCTSITAVSVDGELKELVADGIPGYPKGRLVHRAVILNAAGGENFRLERETAGPSKPSGRAEPDFPADPLSSSGPRHQAGPHNTAKPTGPDDQADWKGPESAVLQNGPEAPEASVGAIGGYLYEPDPALFRMQLVDEAARMFGLSRIHPNIGYLTTSDEADVLPDFPGRAYRIRNVLPYKPRKLKNWLARNRLRKVHIHRRGFPLTVDQLYRKLDCSMGEDAHLVATRTRDDNLVIIVSEKAPTGL